MLTGNPIEIALTIFAVSLAFTVVAAITNVVADKKRPTMGPGAAVNANSLPPRSAEGVMRRNTQRAA